MQLNDKKPAKPETPERGLTEAELAEEGAVDLPEREAMSVIHGSFGWGSDNFAMPINEASAANIYSNNSTAIADADQVVILDQSSEEGTTDEILRPGKHGR